MKERLRNILLQAKGGHRNIDELHKELCDLYLVMPRLICHYNEREGGYLTVGKIYQAEQIDCEGFLIKDDSGDYNHYSTAYLNVV